MTGEVEAQSVLVVGAGFMGSGIAQICAQAGYQVYLMDAKREALDHALNTIQRSLEKLSSKNLLKTDPRVVLKRISTENGLGSAANVGWIVEAVFEDVELKQDIFRQLDQLAPPGTPLASNTSCIPIARIAQATRYPERVLGLHFFGPVPLMPLVEVIRGDNTSSEIFERGVAFVVSLGKSPLRVNRDIPGFVVNRILNSALKEAIDLVDQGIASPEEIDLGLQLGLGWRPGLFEIADNAGLDTCLRVGQSLKELGEESMLSKSDILKRMVAKGHLGRKVGKGFYRYTNDGKRLQR
jgi:3-hydroxybutyryl-CoA dehydrogenase